MLYRCELLWLRFGGHLCSVADFELLRSVSGCEVGWGSGDRQKAKTRLKHSEIIDTPTVRRQCLVSTAVVVTGRMEGKRMGRVFVNINRSGKQRSDCVLDCKRRCWFNSPTSHVVCLRRGIGSSVWPFSLACSQTHLTSSPVARQVNLPNQALTPEIIAKRTKRHLDELEVSHASPIRTCF